MGYQALLFCPDEKLARIVSQLFNELDFSVDPVNEPFAAVKKLMAQKYDAIVVDCDNEQNTSLLFKSARNSNLNQGSLAIALVEGQTGVAKAYRIGANLVLTKPINLEQCKGTLRVARGLLRKGAEGATGAIPAATGTKTAPVTGAPVARPVQSAASTPAVTTTAAAKTPMNPRVETSLPAMAASAKPAEAPAANAIEAPVTSSTPAMHANPSVLVESSAKQPSAIAFSELDRRKEERVVPAIAAPALAAPLNSQGAASAPAPAKEITSPGDTGAPAQKEDSEKDQEQEQEQQPKEEAIKEDAKKEEAKALPVPALDMPKLAPAAAAEHSGSGISEAPTFAALGVEDTSASGGSKKILIGVVALVAFVALAYFGWTQFGQSHPSAVPQQAAPSVNQPAPQNSTPAPPAPMSAPAPAPATTVERAGNSAPERSSKAASQSSKPSPNDAPEITLNSAPEAKKSAEAPLVVRPAAPTSKSAHVEEAVVQIPSPETIGSASGADINGILSSNNVAKPTLSRVKLSQGISQGLLIKRVAPKYPQAALTTHLEGAVHIEATINKEGMVVNPKVVKGDHVLAAAALDAVRQWRYKPYYLDGEPVEVDTEITINFKTN